MKRITTLCAVVCAAATLLFAQPSGAQSPVVHEDDFQSYGTQANPPGWVDTSVGNSKPAANGLYKTWPDPEDATKKNVVYGTKQSSGKPEGRNPRIGTFSTLTTKSFAGKGRFEFRGRMMRTDGDSRIGVTFFSSYPEKDAYYLIGLWSQSSGSKLTMQLFSQGGSPVGLLDSGFTPAPDRWYSFLVQVDETDGATEIRARFWEATAKEPEGFSIEARDTSAPRPSSGRIGVWAAVKGDSYFDDFAAKSPVDHTPPAVTVKQPLDGAVVTVPSINVTGAADDAVSISVNGRAAAIDTTAKTYELKGLELAEGPNEIVVVAKDEVGNAATVKVVVTLDTRAPALTVVAPVMNACIDGTSVQLRGRVQDRAVASVKASLNGAAPVDAVLTPDRQTWTVTFDATAEAQHVASVEALDDLGHRAIASVTFRVDRTAPTIDISESGRPFAAGVLNRRVVPLIRLSDADPLARFTATLNGQPYVSGTEIADGKHQLHVTALDCAAHKSEKAIDFEIDTDAPSILTINPADGSTHGTKPAISGTTSPDATTITVEPGGSTHPVTSGAFTLTALPLIDGVNDLVLIVSDAAGNTSRKAYRVTLKLSIPAVEITLNGVPIAAGALFNRAITPTIRANESDATIAATLDGAAYTVGTPIAAEGAHTLKATASDAHGHTSEPATATFTIDTTKPQVAITSPAAGATIAEAQVEVRGTVTGADVASVSVNTIAATLASGAFTATVPLEAGPNTITATAVDRAGNAATVQVEVTRGGTAPGIVLTAPADGTSTNRTTTIVAGHVLTPSAVSRVTINGEEVPVDPTGAFRKSGHALVEGENTITAAARTSDGVLNESTVSVTADLTAPRLRILESGQPLADESRFPERAILSVEATDGGVAIVPEIFIDNAVQTSPHTVTAAGGHTITAIARDRAGNESRVQRTFFIGGTSAGGCVLERFDPPHGAVVTSNTVTLAGRSGGAAGVKVNGTPALVSGGSFCATVELPIEGDNVLTITCTDAAGAPTGTPVTITLRRATGEPSVTLALPEEGKTTTEETTTVSGTAAGAATVEVNGVAAALNGDAFSVANVRLVPGLNVVSVVARSAAGRTTSASRRVLYLKDAPTLTITSPATSLTTGASTIDVSGLWSNLDPSTIAIAGATVSTTSFSDTSGSFIAASVPLATGQQTITVTGRDTPGRTTSATASVTLTAGHPSISITEPVDNHVFASTEGDTVVVRGAFNAQPGSSVEVGGVTATLDTPTTFSASVPLASGRLTPIVAHVTTVNGASTADTVRVSKAAAKPKVSESFPAANAVQVDPAVMPMILFSAPMERGTTAAAFRLENAGGTAVSGTMRLDRDVLTFAPAALLTSGERYTVRVGTGARSLSGDLLEAEFTSAFIVAATAPRTPPVLSAVPGNVCGSTMPISGTAPAGARLRIDLGTLSFSTTASAAGAWSYQLPIGGSSGHQVVRVRITGTDGSLSTAAESCFVVDCDGPLVTGATFDRAANKLTVVFSKDLRASTLTPSAFQLTLGDGRVVASTVALQTPAKSVVLTPAEDLKEKSFTLTVTTSIEDTTGKKLASPYTQQFALGDEVDPQPGDGTGYISGEVFDAETGRPLAGATIVVVDSSLQSSSDSRGRYSFRVPEGAHTVSLTATGYTAAWRQILVPAGVGVNPIDVRLTPVAAKASSGATELTLTHRDATLRVPAGGVTSGTDVALTRLGAQSLPGLLPLGWSPLRAAVVASVAPALSGAELTFVVPTQTITAASQTLSAVRYDETRDEWVVLAAAVSSANEKAVIAISAPGAYALVYPDAAPGLARPSAPLSGAPLQSAANPCAVTPCPDLKSKSFTLEPRVVLPSEKALVTLNVEGLAPAVYPSGTAVQAHVAEELKLADGSHVSDPPFTTDLLLYRNLTGAVGVAEFQLAPSAMASQVVLDVGFDHINVLPYPGRLDRGTLVGAEGGKVPGDGRVTVEIPAGATTEAIHASTASISDLAQFGTIAGFEVVAGFTLTMQRAAQPKLPEGMTAPGVELLQPAKATFAAAQTSATQFVLAEVLDATPYGRLFRLSSRITALDASRVTTRPIDRATLPLDGIVREGRYLLLKATAPIAFATGTVKTTSGSAIAGARVTAPPLGIADITRTSGLFNVTVPAGTTPFTLVPRSLASGDGATYTHASGAAADSIVVVDLPLVGQPPQLTATEPAANATEVVLAPIVKATFAPGIDPTSVTAASIVVTDTSNGSVVPGRVSAQGTLAVIWTLPAGERLLPNRRYAVTIAPTIRGSNGAPFGVSHVFSFSTITQLSSGEVHAEKIRITIPDANGQSRVTGDAGALPSGWNAVAVRRGVDFVTRFQATAAADGKFAFTITERVALSDMIDLQVVNAAGSVAAIIPLTPFVTEGGLGFVAPTDRAVTFNAANGISVTTEAGTFDEPTVVTIADAPKALFASVPNFATEINFISGLAITFDGTAKKPLEVSIPIPAGTVTDGRTFLLGRLGDSARGPRIEIGDTLRVANGKFTTTEAAAGGSLRVQTLETTTGQKVKDYLLRIVHGAGKWAVIDLNTGGAPLGFAQVNGLAGNLDLFFSSYESLYCSSYYLTASRGRAVFPFLAGTKFVVEGVDSGTGLNVFSKGYDGVPLPPAGGFTEIDSPMPNESGPYPVFGNPFFVHVVDVDASGVKFVVTGEMSVELPDATSAATEVIIARTGLEPARFGAINVTQSKHLEIPEKSPGTGTLDASLGDRLIVYGSAADVAPTGRLEVVFNEAINYGGNLSNLANLVRLDKEEGSAWVAVPVNYEADSGDRRIAIVLRGELQRGGKYRLTLDASIPDAVEAPNTKTLGFDVVLPFTVREPHGKLAAVTIPDGSIRDMALDGNLLFVAATDGDLLAYDVSNPAALDTAAPIARASATAGTPTDIPGDTWSVTVDHHGRIWTTALTDTFGLIRSFRVEDFIPAIPNQVRAATQVAAGIVSWRPGINAGLPLGTTWTTTSDRAEGIPRKMQIAVQDESFRATGGSGFLNAFAGNSLGATAIDAGDAGAANEFSVYSIKVPRTNNSTCFRQQRVTVRNRTLGLRWSGEILGTPSSDPALPCEGSVTITNVLVRDGDDIEVLRNYGTYAVVTLFGYGIGFYDLNAMEHNQRLPRPDKQYAMQLALTEGRVMHPIVPTMEAAPCDPAAQPAGYPCPPRALTFATDTAVVPNAAGFALYPVETRSGIVTVTVDPKAGSQESNGSDPSALTTKVPFAPNGAQVKRSVSDHLIFTGGTGASANDHPRLKPIRDAFAANGRVPATRFTNIERFDVGPKTYGLVAANQFGLLVVDLAAPIGANALADVIWAPAGVYGVRHVRGTHFATAVDGQGRTLLIDLSRVDERSEAASIASCTGTDCLFPTLRKALSVGPDLSDESGWSFGAWDPRIIWRSAKDSERVNGTLAPVADPDTGFIFNGELTQKTIDVLHGIDSRMRVVANFGNGSMQEVTAVVPLGIAPPDQFKDKHPNGSLAAFRVEVALPGSMTESTGAFMMSIESERIPGRKTEASPAITGWPAAHLNEETAVMMRRVVPEGDNTNSDPYAKLRYQKGWNLFVSDPIVAIADPRAAKEYAWGTPPSTAEQETAGCYSCEPPKWAEPSMREIWSMGRFFAIHPKGVGGLYGYLATQGRLEARIGTIMADTVRPKDVLVAAQNPPVADGMIQETIYLHSGELETSAVDLDAGGRAGWNVTLDRTYRSRTVGMTPLGFGWEASYLKRLRPLPNRNVEYRDGAGEVWTFVFKDDVFLSPKGLFLKLLRTERGWMLLDQKWRQTRFDDLGRITSESDEFLSNKTGSGNTIRYVYGSDGRLERIIDPVQRPTKFSYDAAGMLHEIIDWRSRAVTYSYDDRARLGVVEGPNVDNPFLSGSDVFVGRPQQTYEYASAPSASFKDVLELSTNLTKITDPDQSVNGAAGVELTFDLGTNPARRDRVFGQRWSTGETVSFDYPTSTSSVTVDALGQEREYTLSEPAQFDGRVHLLRRVEKQVPTLVFGELPAAAELNLAAPAADLGTTLSYDDHGQITKMIGPNLRQDVMTWVGAANGSPGMVLDRIVTTAPLFGPVETHFSRTEQPPPAEPVEQKATSANNVTAVGRKDETMTGPVYREAQSPSRDRDVTVRKDDDVRRATHWSAVGQATRSEVTPKDGGAPTQFTVPTYYGDAADRIARGRVSKVTAGDEAISITNDYKVENALVKITTKDVVRKTETEEHFDARDLLVQRVVRDIGGNKISEEKFGYDASGRPTRTERRQAGLGFVTETQSYDSLGRVVEASVDQAVVAGSPATLRTRTTYDMANRLVMTSDPFTDEGGVKTTNASMLDGLGRVTRVERRDADGNVMQQSILGYDAAGAAAYESDTVRRAILRKIDVLGRKRGTVRSDGSSTEARWNAWGELEESIVRGPNAEPLSRSRHVYTSKGRLRAINDEIEKLGAARQTRFSWTDGDATTSVRLGGIEAVDTPNLGSGTYRTVQTTRDTAGRAIDEAVGEAEGMGGLITQNTAMWSRRRVSYLGSLPNVITTYEPRVGASYLAFNIYDALGRPTEIMEPGGFTTETEFDEAGNPLAVTPPGQEATKSAFDSRGLETRRTLPDGSAIQTRYDERGVATEYVDEAGQRTKSTTDALGRVTRIDYLADGTFEEFRYEKGSGLLVAKRNRAGQWVSYQYGPEARLLAIRGGEDPGAPESPVLVRYDYQPSGRLALVRNADAGVEFDEYDLLGRAKVTRSYRYAAGTGLDAERVVASVYTQRHSWSIFDGERASWTMPGPGLTAPEDKPDSAWIQTVVEDRDAGGNLIRQSTPGGVVLSEAFGRSAGRIDWRKRPAGTGTITTEFGYADGKPLLPDIELPPVPAQPSTSTGLLRSSRTTFGNVSRAGSINAWDEGRRLGAVQDLGLSERYSLWDYDARGRLEKSQLGVFGPEVTSPPSTETLTPADFRKRRDIASVFTEPQLEILGSAALNIEPPSWAAGEIGAHQIERQTLLLAGVEQTPDRVYAFEGARRTKEGSWTYAFDAFGRLASATSAEERRRITYTWDPHDRLVGRTAWEPGGGDKWLVETRANILVDDGLPAETTFVWDPVTDRLVTIFGANGAVVRQYLHGDQGYDDPIEVRVASEGGGAPTRFLPVIDNAGTGSLQATLDANGDLVERVLYADAYGDAPRYLQGAVVDRISIEAKKDNVGALSEVRVRVHLSERIVGTSVAAGARLRTVRSDHTVSYTHNTAAELEDASTLLWTITPSEWLTLRTAAGAASLEVAVTSALRAEGWGATPVLPLPSWARSIFPGSDATADLPVIKREAFDPLQAFIESIPPNGTESRTVYEIASLYTAASEESKAKLLTAFHAYPFVEPAAGKVYARARWYDPLTGTFLTPDPLGYVDSSNLHAGFANDPVNNQDPTGEAVETVWDAISLGIGGVSLYHNVREGNYGWAALDALGIVVDTAAVLTPFVPGGAGVGLKASRATGMLAKAQLIDQTINVGQGTAQAFNEYRHGNFGWGTFYTAMAGLGVHGMDASQLRFASRGLGSNFGNIAIVGKTGGGRSPVVDPRRLLASATDDFLVGEKLVSKTVFENYIVGKPSFQLGAPGSTSFFFNRAGANAERNSLWAGIQAGFTRENLLQTAFEGGNELVKLRFDLRYLDRVAVPGVSRFSDGFGAMPIGGANALFTGNGKVRNMFGELTFDEFIGPNTRLPAEALLTYEYLGRIIR